MAKCQNLFKACLVWRLWMLISKRFQSMNLWRWALGCCQSSTSIPHLTTRYKKCARWSFQNPFLMQPTWGQAVQLALLQSRPCCIHACSHGLDGYASQPPTCHRSHHGLLGHLWSASAISSFHTLSDSFFSSWASAPVESQTGLGPMDMGTWVKVTKKL